MCIPIGLSDLAALLRNRLQLKVKETRDTDISECISRLQLLATSAANYRELQQVLDRD